jgi:CheY-like chemotaxis protein
LENSHHPQQSGKILLAEDNFYTIEGLVDYLTYLGYEVYVAIDGERVVQQAAEIKPDLIIIDIQLPKRDGLEAIKLIRSDFAIKDVPIIALTAMTMPGDRERCLAAGASEFISKPFNIHQVTDVFRQFGLLKD